MKISMILPIYNESSTIDGMMDQLRALPGDWEQRRHGPEDRDRVSCIKKPQRPGCPDE